MEADRHAFYYAIYVRILCTVPFRYHPGYITIFALRGGSGIVYYVFIFVAPGLPGIGENKVPWVGEQ